MLAIACGGHAGDADSMARVIECAVRRGIEIGAHPSYVDREGFGRRSLAIEPAELTDQVFAQCAALAGVAAAHGARVTLVKPHGALYHDASHDAPRAAAVIDGAVRALGAIALIGPSWGAPSNALRDAAESRGLRYLREGFADRARRPDGSLVPRGEPGALLADPAVAAAQARALAHQVDTICVHGDSPGALAIARAVRAALRGLPA